MGIVIKPERFLGSQSVGVFHLQNIFFSAAFARVMDRANYDIVTNNCATFVIDVLKSLQIDVTNDARLLAFVAEKLAEHAGNAAATRASPMINNISQDNNDLVLMMNLVRNYVDTH